MAKARGSTKRKQKSLTPTKNDVSDLAHPTANAGNSPTKPKLSLKEGCTQLGGQSTVDNSKNGINSSEPDLPLLDDRSQIEGAKAFQRFERQVKNLDKQLHSFSNAARKIGGSVNILSSIFRLRIHLNHLLELFGRNAALLFPRLVSEPRRKPQSLLQNNAIGQGIHKYNSLQKMHSMADSQANPDLEQLPEKFDLLAESVGFLLKYLNEFPDFSNGSVDASSIESFEHDLRFWADCFREYKGRFDYLEIRRYLHDFTTEAGGLGEHMDTVAKTVLHFTDIGIPAIHVGQQHSATTLQNLSTVATFFSAVTATTIQFSYEKADTFLARAVNAFWFASLVFSVSSVVNSLLGLTWRQTVHRSPTHKTPSWVLIWIEHSPLLFLVVAIACFAVGLVLFTYTSNQGFATCIVTAVFTSFSSLGIIAISAWFASERWTLSESRYQDPNTNTTSTFKEHISQRSLVEWSVTTYNTTMDGSKRYFTTLIDTLTLKIKGLFGISPGGPTAHTEGSSSPQISDFSSTSSTPDRPTRTFSRWRAAICILTFTRLIRSGARKKARTSQPEGMNNPSYKSNASDGDRLGGSSHSRLMDATSQELQKAALKRTWSPSHASVSHLQFSPDGKYLVMLSQSNKTGIIFKFEDLGSESAQTDAGCLLDGPVEQAAWSPDGTRLITKHERNITVWTNEGINQNSFNRNRTIQSVVWMPKGEAFLSIEVNDPEGSEVVKLDLAGNEIETYKFGRISLRNIAVTPDLHRIVGVGVLTKSTEGLLPSKSKREKRLIIYKTDTKEIVSQVPLFNSVCDITMERNSRAEYIALVSYKNNSSPQLWKLGSGKNKNGKEEKQTRLSLIRTYMPKITEDFAGSSHFGGKDNQLVLCATKRGDICFWHREMGTLLYHIAPTRSDGDDIACISCNRAQEGLLMFATGSQDGSIRIWTVPEPTRAPSLALSTRSSRDSDISSNSSVTPTTTYEGSLVLSAHQTLDLAQTSPSISLTPVPAVPHSIRVDLGTQSPARDQTQQFPSSNAPNGVDDATPNHFRQSTADSYGSVRELPKSKPTI